MIDHELRRQVVGEMHLRRWPVLQVPSLVIQWVLIVEDDEREVEAEQIARLPAEASASSPSHRAGEFAPQIAYAWERHSEGSSLALFIDGIDEATLASGELPELVHEAIAWAESLPGKVMRATQIFVVSSDASAEQVLPSLQFNRAELISCNFGGSARMWGDFRLKQDGFGKLVVAANNTDIRDFTRYLQRLQDLGNYRNKALMGLPTAQKAWPRLDRVGQRLAELADNVADESSRDDKLMEELSSLSLELNSIANAVDYRMSATAAYAQLVRDRLEELRVERIDGFASLVDFTQRRFLPAVRTCAAVTERERRQSERASELASLLRARIETRIENQNAELLRSMDRSARMQLRLQQLVEGLSVVALSYYLLGLLGYLLKGSSHVIPGMDAELLLAALVIPVVAIVWGVVRLLKKRLLKDGS